MHSDKVMARATCPWSLSFHNGNPHCSLISTGGPGHQHLSPLASTEGPTFPSDLRPILDLGKRGTCLGLAL